jgi:hypothetical protein
MLLSSSKRDFVSLLFNTESLQQCAVALGFRKFHESCENIRRASAILSLHGEFAEAIEIFRLTLIKEEISNLNGSLLAARTTIDFFYKDRS